MKNQSEKISNALKQNSFRILMASKEISKNPTYGFIANQVLRSATSAGANYEEACGAESHADFIHKLHITYKELRETKYWLGLIQISNLGDKEVMNGIISSTDELLKVIGKSLITCKKNSGKKS
jgi:four helix bundle protein